ncbi:MAG: invasion-associated protein [Mycobacterium sp.]|nr:invasion-associated protein [Mycobacterium sp.]
MREVAAPRPTEMEFRMRRIYALAISLALLVATPAVATADTNPSPASRQQAIDYLTQRGLSQRGVPYLYGGGNAAGPSRGTGPDANTVGFDASGLMQYAFAGVGIKLPRSSAEQYNAGRKVAPAQARPGDMIFYGPGGSQSVAMYLGNGQMLEATEPVVMVSPARTVGMTPYLTRIIEW